MYYFIVRNQSCGKSPSTLYKEPLV